MHNDSKKLIITGEKGHRSIFWNQSYRFWGLVLQHLVGPQKRIQQAFHTLAGSLYNLRRKEAASHCSGQSGAGVSCWHFSLCVVPYIYICSQSFLGWNASTREGLGTVVYSCDSCSLVTQLCLTVCDSMNCGLPGSSVHGILQARNTGVDSKSLFQGIFSTQGWNPGLLHCRQILYHLSHQEALITVNALIHPTETECVSPSLATEGGTCSFRGSDGAGVLWKPGAQMTAPPRDCVS